MLASPSILLTAAVTVLAVVLYMYTAIRVGNFREKHNISAPTVTGHPEFERAYREARVAGFRQSTVRLQQASSPAVTTLLKIMVDPAAPLAVKARCAYYILDHANKAIETEEIEARVTALERANETSQGDT